MLNNMAALSIPKFLTDTTCKSELPTSTDVLVIGGGLLGAALAYYLSKEGVEVLLVERGELNREASGTNAGSFHFQIALHQLTSSNSSEQKKRLLDEVRLQLDASQLWHGLEGELGRDLGVHFTGGIMVAETTDELQVLRDKQEIEEKAGLETQVFIGDEMRNFAPYLAPDLSGIAFCSAEGHANPLIVGPTYAYRAHEMGASIRTGCEVLEVEVHAVDHPFRFTAKTNRGSIRCNRIVNATGAWATEISGTLGIKLPMGLSGLHVNVTEPRERILKPMVQHIGRRLTLKQTSNNTFIIGGGWPARPEVFPRRYSNYWNSAAGNAAVAVRVMPMLKDVRLVRTWTGVWAFTTDFKPILGESRKIPGYHVAMVPTGFTLGPMVATLLAEYMVSNGRSNPIPEEFNPDRGQA